MESDEYQEILKRQRDEYADKKSSDELHEIYASRLGTPENEIDAEKRI